MESILRISEVGERYRRSLLERSRVGNQFVPCLSVIKRRRLKNIPLSKLRYYIRPKCQVSIPRNKFAARFSGRIRESISSSHSSRGLFANRETRNPNLSRSLSQNYRDSTVYLLALDSRLVLLLNTSVTRNYNIESIEQNTFRRCKP